MKLYFACFVYVLAAEEEIMTENELEKELEKRIQQVENAVSEVAMMTKKDYIEAGVIIAVCLAGIILGAFL